MNETLINLQAKHLKIDKRNPYNLISKTLTNLWAMHFSINAHAVQGFSLKQVRACLKLEPLSLKLNGSRCGLAYGLPCGLLYVLLYVLLHGFLYGLLCGLLYSLLRELLYGLLCSVRHAFPLLLPFTSVFNT